MSVYLAVSEKTGGQTDKQTNKQTERMTDKPTKQKDYTSPALAGAGDYNKQTELEGYSRHSRQPSLNDSHLLLVSAYIIYRKSEFWLQN